MKIIRNTVAKREEVYEINGGVPLIFSMILPHGDLTIPCPDISWRVSEATKIRIESGHYKGLTPQLASDLVRFNGESCRQLTHCSHVYPNGNTVCTDPHSIIFQPDQAKDFHKFLSEEIDSPQYPRVFLEERVDDLIIQDNEFVPYNLKSRKSKYCYVLYSLRRILLRNPGGSLAEWGSNFTGFYGGKDNNDYITSRFLPINRTCDAVYTHNYQRYVSRKLYEYVQEVYARG